MATSRLSLTFCWPMNSRRRCGRSFSSNEESSSSGAAETTRSRSGCKLSLGRGTQGDGKAKAAAMRNEHRVQTTDNGSHRLYHSHVRMKNLGILLSGRGSNFEAIADNVASGKLDANIAVVISNRPDAGGIESAQRRGLNAAGDSVEGQGSRGARPRGCRRPARASRSI